MEFYRLLYTFILKRRYKIKFEGLDVLESSNPKLFLPNHISHIDPQIMTVVIYKYTNFVPLVAERFFKIPVIKYFLRRLEAVKIGDFKKGNIDVDLIHRINHQIVDALAQDKSALIFPAGQLSSGGIERLYNKQSAHGVVGLLPDNASVVGVRIKGLWGSSFSKAWNGKRPVFLSTFLLAILYFFSNLIFLCPKRNITLQFVDITLEAKEKAKISRKAFNLFLEDFYNQEGPEKPSFVRHLFFFPRIKNKVTTL